MRRLSSRTIFICALVLPVTAVAAGQGPPPAPTRTRVGISHQGGGMGTDGLFDDMRARYSGHFAIARDLAVF